MQGLLLKKLVFSVPLAKRYKTSASEPKARRGGTRGIDHDKRVDQSCDSWFASTSGHPVIPDTERTRRITRFQANPMPFTRQPRNTKLLYIYIYIQHERKEVASVSRQRFQRPSEIGENADLSRDFNDWAAKFHKPTWYRIISQLYSFHDRVQILMSRFA